jgi:hypothetical protein
MFNLVGEERLLNICQIYSWRVGSASDDSPVHSFVCLFYSLGKLSSPTIETIICNTGFS